MSRSSGRLGSGPLVLVLNGPNLGALGRREPDVYGRRDLGSLVAGLAGLVAELGIAVEATQSEHEGELVSIVLAAGERGARAAVLNPGALAHTSYALRDAVAAAGIPVVEVHLSNVHARERWRSRLVIAPVAAGVVAGLGPLGYELALRAAASLVWAAAPRASAPGSGTPGPPAASGPDVPSAGFAGSGPQPAPHRAAGFPPAAAPAPQAPPEAEWRPPTT